jgi:beta-mannan synthase
LPMFNERAVCQSIIDCCCELDWPSSRLYIQILDDSTDQMTRDLVDEKLVEWRERGVAIDCLRRTNRQGYKAGAMKEASSYHWMLFYNFFAVAFFSFSFFFWRLDGVVPYSFKQCL